MLSDPESPAPPPQQWSVKKITLWCCGILLIFAVAILAYDEKLEPYDDLLPTVTVVPDAKTNGYVFLRERWENLPEFDKADRVLAKNMQQGREPWDDSLVMKLRKGRESCVSDLRTALAMPQWVTDPLHTKEQNASAFQDKWIIPTFVYLGFEVTAAGRAGNNEAAIALAKNLHRWSHRQIAGSSNIISSLIGSSLLASAAESCCGIIAQGNLERSQLDSLSLLWQDDPPAQLALEESYRGELQNFRNQLKAPDYLTHVQISDKPLPSSARFVFKKNLTTNRYHRLMRQLIDGLLKPTPTQATSTAARLQKSIQSQNLVSWWMDANFVGSRLTDNHVSTWLKSLNSLPLVYFRGRALSVKLAIHRWQADHSGGIPDTLDQLVPKYLASIPSDPWNGNPLMWDRGSQIIYAVGSDWVADLPVFLKTDQSWFAGYSESPGLRMAVPGARAP